MAQTHSDRARHRPRASDRTRPGGRILDRGRGIGHSDHVDDGWNRTVTVGGHYKNMTQESLADGVKVVVDGHVILVSADQLTVDGKTQVLEPGQDVEVLVDSKGAVEVKLVRSD